MESSRRTASGHSAPLAGVRVADLSRVLAGPYCTMVLADLGADVVKVERPEGGDETRSWGPPFAGGEAAYYLSVNRNKRSCALDLSQDEGRALALELCARADIVIENFKVGGARPARRGLRRRCASGTRASSTARSPASAPSARRPGRPGYDFVAQAETGLMSITGARGGAAVQGGRRARGRAHRPPRGRRGARRAARGRGRPDRGAAARQRPRGARERGPERAGHGTGAGAAWKRAPEHRALPGLRDLVRPDRGGRGERRPVPRAVLRAWASRGSAPTSASPRTRAASSTEESSFRCSRSASATAPAEDWLTDLDAAGVPAGKVRSVPDALAAAAAAGRPATHTVDHPTAGPLELVASPIWGATRAEATPAAAARSSTRAEVLRRARSLER